MPLELSDAELVGAPAIVAGAALADRRGDCGGMRLWHSQHSSCNRASRNLAIFMNACALSGYSQHESTMQMCGAEVAP